VACVCFYAPRSGVGISEISGVPIFLRRPNRRRTDNADS
jgi:hypothetical protein